MKKASARKTAQAILAFTKREQQKCNGKCDHAITHCNECHDDFDCRCFDPEG